MGNLKKFEVVFEHPHAVYKAGEQVLGHVVVDSSEPMKVKSISIRFEGRARIDCSRRHVEALQSEEIYFEETRFLYGSDRGDTSIHKAGVHKYFFDFDIPVNCPSSFESGHGCVRYTCRASISRPLKPSCDTKAAFTVLSILDLNNEPGNLRAPAQVREQKQVNRFCCGSGSVSALVKIDKTGYVPGENMVIYAEIDNNTNFTINSTEAVLKQYALFRSKTRGGISPDAVTPIVESEDVASLKHDSIDAGSSYVWKNAMLRVPPLPPSRLVGCDLIELYYVLKFHVNAWANMKLEIDVIIGTVPLRKNVTTARERQRGTTSALFMDSLLERALIDCEVLPPPDTQDSPPPGPSMDPLLEKAFIDCEVLPPSYQQCVKGQRKIHDDRDSVFTRQVNWAPSYPTFEFDGPVQASAPPYPDTEPSLASAPPSVSDAVCMTTV